MRTVKENLQSLTLATCLVFVPATGQAVSLGAIQIHSTLNAPLKAYVPLAGTKGLSTDHFQVSIADLDAYESLHIPYNSLLQTLSVAVKQGADGGLYVAFSSSKPVTDPYLIVLLRLSWQDSQTIRKYTVLLSPPEYATPTAKEPILLTAEQKPTTEPKAAIAQTVSEQQIPTSSPQDDRTKIYGPVTQEDTLESIARRFKSEGVTNDQFMLAVVAVNPTAFDDGNVNTLKVGHTLVMPTHEDIQSISTRSAAKAVQQEIDNWQDGRQTHQALPAASHPASIQAKAPASASALKPIAPIGSPLEQMQTPTNHPTGEIGESDQSLQAEINLSNDTIRSTERKNQMLQLEVQKEQKELQALKSQNAALGKALVEKNKELLEMQKSTEKFNADFSKVMQLLQHSASTSKTGLDQFSSSQASSESLAANNPFVNLWGILLLVMSTLLGAMFVWMFLRIRYQQQLENLMAKLIPAQKAPDLSETKSDASVAVADAVLPTEVLAEATETQINGETPPVDETDVVVAAIAAPEEQTATSTVAAVCYAAETEMEQGLFDAAQARLLAAIAIRPDETALWEKLLELFAISGNEDAFVSWSKKMPEPVQSLLREQFAELSAQYFVQPAPANVSENFVDPEPVTIQTMQTPEPVSSKAYASDEPSDTDTPVPTQIAEDIVAVVGEAHEAFPVEQVAQMVETECPEMIARIETTEMVVSDATEDATLEFTASDADDFLKANPSEETTQVSTETDQTEDENTIEFTISDPSFSAETDLPAAPDQTTASDDNVIAFETGLSEHPETEEASSHALASAGDDLDMQLSNNFDFETVSVVEDDVENSGEANGSVPTDVAGMESDVDEISFSTESDETGNDDAMMSDADDEIQSLLDMANVYLEMGDYGSAKEMCEQVIQQGNAIHQAKAQALLNQCG